MRLTCPNCDAQYEVPDSAIPAGGRDVQCSNCGHFWYQMPPGEGEEAFAADDLGTETAEQSIARAMGASDADAEPPERAPAAPEPDPDPAPRPEAAEMPQASAPAEDDSDTPSGTDTASAARPKTLDESLVALLKEEAEREVQARRLEVSRTSPMPEMQPDLGLAEPDETADRARRLAALQGLDPEPAPARPTARRDLLPDVEEINSTLQTSEVEARQADAELARLPDLMRPKRGFRSGFSLIMILLIVGIAAYVAAPQLKVQFPAAAPTVEGFVTAVDDAREWLEVMMDRASAAIQGPADN